MPVGSRDGVGLQGSDGTRHADAKALKGQEGGQKQTHRHYLLCAGQMPPCMHAARASYPTLATRHRANQMKMKELLALLFNGVTWLPAAVALYTSDSIGDGWQAYSQELDVWLSTAPIAQLPDDGPGNVLCGASVNTVNRVRNLVYCPKLLRAQYVRILRDTGSRSEYIFLYELEAYRAGKACHLCSDTAILPEWPPSDCLHLPEECCHFHELI